MDEYVSRKIDESVDKTTTEVVEMDDDKRRSDYVRSTSGRDATTDATEKMDTTVDGVHARVCARSAAGTGTIKLGIVVSEKNV